MRCRKKGCGLLFINNGWKSIKVRVRQYETENERNIANKLAHDLKM